MADNSPITPGAGLNVASDEAPYSGDTVQVQIAQLAEVTGAEGSRTLTKIGSAAPLPVRTPTTVTVEATFTRPSDTTAYAAGDVMSDSTSAPTVLTFANCAFENGGGGEIIDALLIDSANQATKVQAELWLFDTTPGATNDNAVIDWTDAELEKVVAVIPFGASYAGIATAGAGGNCVLTAPGVGQGFKCASGTKDLLGVLVARNIYTPVSAEVFRIRLKIRQG